MKDIEFKLQAIDAMLEQNLSLANKLASSAWFLTEKGDVQYTKPVFRILESWELKYGGILNGDSQRALNGLYNRVSEWMINLGTNDTPAAIISDKVNSFHRLRMALMEEKKSLFELLSKNTDNPNMTFIMGDSFEQISNSTIVNRSTVQASFNRVQDKFDAETASALYKVSEIIQRSGNKEAGELFDAFNEEMKKEQPNKSLLKTIWKGITETVPVLLNTAGIVEKISNILQ